jgi:predicted nuclease of predicted toxin-antitoxin system
MKFLVDMGIARSTADFLCDKDYDAVHLREQGLQRMDDESIV